MVITDASIEFVEGSPLLGIVEVSVLLLLIENKPIEGSSRNSFVTFIGT
jgi:hypothetical protein